MCAAPCRSRLAKHGVTTRTLVPGYPVIMSAFKKKKPVHQYADLHGGKAALHAVRIGGLDLLVLEAAHLFDRTGGPYGDAGGKDWPDNWRRFATLSQVGSDIAAGAIGDYVPDIVHVHDWQAALTLGLYALRPGGRHAIGDHRAQSGFPRAVRRLNLSRTLACLHMRWRWTAWSITAGSAI